MRKIVAAGALLVCTLLLSGVSFADTLNPGDTIIATFGANKNASDLLVFLNNDPLVLTGSPILTLTLYDGSTVLGSITAPPVGSTVRAFANYFASASTVYNDSNTPHTTVDFGGINAGTIAGRLTWTVTGGSVSGFSLSDFVLYDALGITSGGYFYSPPTGNLTGINISLQAVPEPSSLLLLTTGLLGLAGMTGRKRLLA